MIRSAMNAACALSLIAVRKNDGAPSGSVNDGRVADAEQVIDPSWAMTRCSSGALSDPTVPTNAVAPPPCSSPTTSSIVRLAASAAEIHSTVPPSTPPAALRSSTASVMPRCWPIDSSFSSPAPGSTNPSTSPGGPAGAAEVPGAASVAGVVSSGAVVVGTDSSRVVVIVAGTGSGGHSERGDQRHASDGPGAARYWLLGHRRAPYFASPLDRPSPDGERAEPDRDDEQPREQPEEDHGRSHLVDRAGAGGRREQ